MNILGLSGSIIIRARESDVDPSQHMATVMRLANVENEEPAVEGWMRPKRTSKLRVKIPQAAPEEIPHRRCPIHIGKMYELDDGRFGVCMFLGKTLFNKKGLWVGLQLENAKGKHNGTVHGKKYFLCREDRGVFVRPCRIKRVVTEVSKSNINPLDKKVIKDPRRNRYIRKQTIMDLINLTTPSLSKREMIEYERRNSHRERRMSKQSQNSEDKSEASGWKPAEYGMTPDHGLCFKPKTFYTEKELHSHDGEERSSKLTVSQIMEEGFPVDWKEAQFDNLSDLTDHGGLFYPRSKLHKHLNEKADRKPGAIETGYANNYRQPEYPGRQYSIERDQYYLHYLKSKLHENDGEHVDRKPGAIEIGKSDYKTAQYDVDTSIEKRQYGLYHSIYELHKRDGEQTAHKEWATEIGRADGYHQALYSVDWDPITLAQYGLYYNPRELQRNWDKRNRRDSNVSSIKEDQLYQEDTSGIWTQSANTSKVEETRLSSLSSKGSSSGEWPDSSPIDSNKDSVLVMSRLTPSTEFSLQSITHQGGFLPDLPNKKERVDQDAAERLRKGAPEEEVDAYIPSRFLPRRLPKTRLIGPRDLARRHQSVMVFPGYKKANFRYKDTEGDFFMKDILNLAQNKIGERRQKERTRSLSRSLFLTPLYDVTPRSSDENPVMV